MRRESEEELAVCDLSILHLFYGDDWAYMESIGGVAGIALHEYEVDVTGRECHVAFTYNHTSLMWTDQQHKQTPHI